MTDTRSSSGSATSPIDQADVEMLKHLADGMGFGRTHDMLRRVIAACPYLTRTPAITGRGEAVTDAMVHEACEAYGEVYRNDDKDMGDAMRAALKAALLLGDAQGPAGCGAEIREAHAAFDRMLRANVIEECAKIADQIAINAERRAADHTFHIAKDAANNKADGARDVAYAIRERLLALSSTDRGGK